MSEKVNRSLQKILTAGLFVFLWARCAPVYVPNIRNTPLFEKKGEFQVTASFGTGYHLQTAFALSNHIGITLNGAIADNRNAQKFQYRTHQLAEGGVGYFGRKNKLYFEVYGGYGIGKGKAMDSVYYVFHDDMLYSAKSTYSRISIQPAIGTKHDNFEWSFAARLSHVNYHRLTVFYQSDPVAVASRDYLYFEPSASLKIAMRQKKMFFMMQTGLNIPMYNESGNEFDVERFSGGVGLQFRITPKQKN